MHPELAPPAPPLARRRAELDAIVAREHQLTLLQLEQRQAIAAFYDTRGAVSEKFVGDELALAWHRSPRQGANRLTQALVWRDFPAVHARVADGTWLLDHGDAVVTELSGTGLDHDAQTQALDLVLSRPGQRTPYELRQAVRMAVVALFPDHAWEVAKKAHTDRDVQTYPDSHGGASLIASGSATDVAAMMASIDALCTPADPDDPRTLAQRRFDTIRQLVCGQAQPGQWTVVVLTELTTVTGTDDHPAELVGHGPVPAPVARHAASHGELRRAVIDHTGRLVAVDAVVHRPDQAPALLAPFPVFVSDDNWDEPVEPDPDAPSPADLAWHDAHTDRGHALTPAPAPVTIPQQRQPLHLPGLSQLERHALAALPLAPPPAPPEQPPTPGPWSPEALTRALHRIATDPLTPAELSTDKYRPTTALRRHLVLRDRTCIWPGCHRPADQCDKDHLREWPHGPTSEVNLADECPHHHHGKHDGFTVQRLPDGTFRWTTPTGHTHDRPPRPVLDNHRDRPPPDEEQQ